MRREMKAEWARDQYFKALSGFQRECPTVVKSHQVRDKDKVTKADKGLRYSYAAMEDLVEQAKPYLEKWGFSFTIKCQQSTEDVTAICHAHHIDGHEEVNSFRVPIDPAAYMSDPQKMAAALTFATRYCFKNAFGIQTKGEDREERLMDEPRPVQRTVQQPRATAPIPVQHEVRSVKDEFDTLAYAVEAAPGTTMKVNVWTKAEIEEWREQANTARKSPDDLADVMERLRRGTESRIKAIKGEK
jgi:hypothetical protein